MEIDMSAYYWKNSVIQLRQSREEDWVERLPNLYNSEARFFFNDEIDMPVDADEQKRKHLEFLQKPDYVCFVIENSEGKHVGVCNLFGVNERHGKFGPIGVQINPAFRRMGYGLAALRMLGEYMFNERRMHKWNSGYIEANAASAALHKKLGFTVEGIQRDDAFHNGRYWNAVLCGITETEFFQNEKKLHVIR